MKRISTKRKRGKATGMSCSAVSNQTGKRQEIMDRTDSEHRRREREFERAVLKAYRGVGGELPEDPHPTSGGYYAT